MPRNLIVGDIHSEYDKLVAVLDKASFDPTTDILYSLGDFCDRGRDALKTLRFLMGIDNLRAVIGNHDSLLQNWLFTGVESFIWEENGGGRTVEDLQTLPIEEKHRIGVWLQSLPLARVEDRYIIVHGGIPYRRTLGDMEAYARAERPKVFFDTLYSRWDESCIWDRDYMLSAYVKMYPEVSESIFMEASPLDTEDRMIFVGHTPTLDGKPFISEEYNLVALDTGSGHGGPLTLMDMDSLEYWQA